MLLLSADRLLEQLTDLFSRTPCILFFAMIYVLCLRYVDTNKMPFLKFKAPILPFALTFCAGCIVNFPVWLGYGGEYFPDRCVFVQDTTIYIGLFLSVCYLAAWTKKQCGEIHKEAYIGFGMGVLVLLCSIIREAPIKEWTSYMLWKEVSEVKEYADYWEGVLDEIAQSEDTTVVIERDYVINSNIFRDVELSNDADFWVNQAAALYYNKNSIILKIGDS